MPITQENAASHCLLLKRWLREQERLAEEQQWRNEEARKFGRPMGELQRLSDGPGSPGSPGPGQPLCQAAIRKLVEYIQLNFLEGEDPPTPPLPQPKESPRESGESSEAEVRPVYLAKGDNSDNGDGGEFGLSFGNIPIFGDPDGGKKGSRRRRRKGDTGPVLDVGCIWVTEVKKRSPAARCGDIKLRDELLSLNGQLMVGVDVTGAR